MCRAKILLLPTSPSCWSKSAIIYWGVRGRSAPRCGWHPGPPPPPGPKQQVMSPAVRAAPLDRHPPLFFTPPPLSRQPPISYLLNTRPVPWEGFTAPSVVQFKRNPLERSQNSQPVFQIFSTMIILIGLLLSYSCACYSWRSSTSLLLHICTYVASAPTYLHLHVHLHLRGFCCTSL